MRIPSLSAHIKTRCMDAIKPLLRLINFAETHSQGIFWSLALFYRISIDLLYCYAAHPVGGYMIRPFLSSALRYIISFILYLFLFASLPKKEENSIAFAVHLQFVYTVAPLLTLYAFSDMSSRYILMVSICILVENVIIFRPLKISAPIRIKNVQNYMTVMFGILMVFTLAVSILYNGFAGLKAFDLFYIYEMRANATYPIGFRYLLNWMTRAVLPFGFLCFLHTKRYHMAILLAIVQVVFYMQTGVKFLLFILIPMLFIYFCAKTGHCLKLLYLGLSTGYLLILLICRLDYLSPADPPLTPFVGIFAASIISVRALFIPAGIKSYFYDYFSTHPKLLFSDGQIGRMLGLTYPYKASSGFVIDAYMGNSFGSSNSNTGYLGEAYAQLGFAGMLLMSILLALLLRSLRVHDRSESAPLLTALISIYMIILNDGALFTTLFTNGLFVTYCLIFIYFDKVAEGANNGIQRL